MPPCPPASTSPTPPSNRWHVLANEYWLAAALEWVNRAADAALTTRGEFHLVLAGGGTPKKLYQELAKQNNDWAHWHIWFGDERCLPANDPLRNSRMAAAAWLDQVAIPGGNIHVIPAELGANAAAEVYARELVGCDVFDLVLLGLGQDGHTASLFPKHDWGIDSDAPDVLAVENAPKPPPDRVTLSARRLSRARGVLFLICGADKRDALTLWRQGVIIPATSIQPDAGIDLLIDTDACPPGEPK